MTWSLEQIWRYPIKGVGAEQLNTVELSPNRPVPLDRAWAVLEEGGEDGEGWRSCRNFLRSAKGPGLMAISARVDGDRIHLSHPDAEDLTIDPTKDAQTLFHWLSPLYPADRRPPVALQKAPPQGMLDTPFASISLINTSSLRALGQRLGITLNIRRFRANLLIDGLAPWEEFDLVGKTLRIGDVHLEVVERIKRCRATEANPDTGRRDANTLSALKEGWGHQDFGVYAKVLKGGTTSMGDTVSLV